MRDRLPPDPQIVEEMQQLVTASLAGRLSFEQGDRLEELIRQNIDACDLYLNLIHQWSLLLDWAGVERNNDSVQAESFPTLQSVETGRRSFAAEQTAIPAAPIYAASQDTRFGIIFHHAIGSFASDWVQAYLIGILLTGLGLLIGSWISVRHYTQVADSLPVHGAPNKGTSLVKDIAYVGRITGTVNVRWADSTTAAVTELVPLGRRYSLASGLMEISYDTGASVILQGPVTFEVNSRNGGFLSVGKLTARLEKKPLVVNGQRSEKVASGQWPVSGKEGAGGRVRGAENAANNQSLVASEINPQIPKSQIPNSASSPAPRPPSLAPVFAVQTPTAIITDLGTEFGVEVDRGGSTTSHVFRGEVEVRLAGVHGEQAIRLLRNESAMAVVEEDRQPKLRRVAFKAEGFARQMPEPQSVVLLHDTFDIRKTAAVYSDNGEFGLNQDLSQRQSGVYRQVRYRLGGDYVNYQQGFQSENVQVNHWRCPGKLCLMADYGQAGWVVLNRCFPRNIVVSAELTPEAVYWPDKSQPDTYDLHHRSPNWIALGVRGRGIWFDRNLLPLATDAGAVLFISSNGSWGYFENGRRIACGDVSAVAPYRVVMQVVGNKLNAKINEIPLNLAPDHPGGVRTLGGMAAETSGNYISFGVSNGISVGGINMNAAFELDSRPLSAIDNLTVSTVGAESHNATKN